MKRSMLSGMGVMVTIILFVTELYCQQRFPLVLPEKQSAFFPIKDFKVLTLPKCFSKKLQISGANLSMKEAIEFIEYAFSTRGCNFQIVTKDVDENLTVRFNESWPDSTSVLKAVSDLIKNTQYKMMIDGDHNTIYITN